MQFNIRKIGTGLIAADVISAVLFSIYTYLTDTSGLGGISYLLVLLFVGMAYSLIAVTIFGLVPFLILRKIQLVNFWTILAIGFFVGAAAAWFTERPTHGIRGAIQFDFNDHATRRFFALAVIGLLSSISFYAWSKWAGPSKADRDLSSV